MSVYLRLPTYEKRPLVKAIVFYGRRYTARLLNCYLERNLLKNGGLVSEVCRKFRGGVLSQTKTTTPATSIPVNRCISNVRSSYACHQEASAPSTLISQPMPRMAGSVCGEHV